MSGIRNKVYIKPAIQGDPAVLHTLTDNYGINNVQFSNDPTILDLLHPIFPGDDITAEGIFTILKDLVNNDNILADKTNAANEAFSEGVFDLSRSTLSAAQETELELLIADRDAGWLHTDDNDSPYTESEEATAVIRLAFLLIRKYFCSFAISTEDITAYAGFYGTFDLPNIASVAAVYSGVPAVGGSISVPVLGTAITIKADNTNLNTAGARGNVSLFGNGSYTIAQKLTAALPRVYNVFRTYIGLPIGITGDNITIYKDNSALGNGTTTLTFNGTDTLAVICTAAGCVLTATDLQKAMIPTAGSISLFCDDTQIPIDNWEMQIKNGADEIFVTSKSVIVTSEHAGTLYNKVVTGDGTKTIDQLINKTDYARYNGKPSGFTSDVIILETITSGATVTLTADGTSTLQQLLDATGRTFVVTYGTALDANLVLSANLTILAAASTDRMYVFDSSSDETQILKLSSTIELAGGSVIDSFYDGTDIAAKIQVGPGKIKIYEEDQDNDTVYFVRNEGEVDPEDPIVHPADGIFYVDQVPFDEYYRRDLVSVVFRDTENIEGKVLPYLKYEYGVPSAEISPRHNIVSNKVLTDTYGSYPLWSTLYKRSSDRTWILKSDQIFAWSGLRALVTFERLNPYERVNGSLAVHTYKDTPLFNLTGEALIVDYGESATAATDSIDGDTYLLPELESILQTIPTELDAISEDDSTAFTFPFIIDELYNDYITYSSVELRELNILTEQLSAYTGKDGIEANFYTLPRFANASHNSEMAITEINIVNNKHRIIVSDTITNYSYTTLNGSTWTGTRYPAAGDVILIVDGIGKGQLATINSIGTIGDYTEIFLTNQFLNPIPEVTAKVIILKADEETKVGFSLTDAFLASLSTSEQADYATQYYPKDASLPDRHSGTSRLPYSSKSFFRGTISAGVVDIEAAVDGVAGDATITGDGAKTIVQLITELAPAVYTINSGGSLIPATGEVITITGGKIWENANSGWQLIDQLTYAETVPSTHKKYSGTASLITFPFKLRININQYYFAKICVARKIGSGVSYGTTVKVALTDNTNPIVTQHAPYFTSTYHKNAGLYPGISPEGKDFFRIFHKYYLTGYYELKDIENQEPSVVNQRVTTETAYGSTIFLPPYWKPVAKNLDSVLAEEEITPPARALNLIDPMVRKYDVTAPGIVYVDVQAGKIMFHPDDQPILTDIMLTFTKDNVVTGRLDTESILHIVDPEAATPQVVTLRSVIESIQVAVNEDAIILGANSIMGNATPARTEAQDLYVGASEFLMRPSAGDIQSKPFTDYSLTLVASEDDIDARAILKAVSTDTNETIDGIKTFLHFPLTPSMAPSTDFEVANKAYVDISTLMLVNYKGTYSQLYIPNDLYPQQALLMEDETLISDGSITFTDELGVDLGPMVCEQKYPVSRIGASNITGVANYLLFDALSESYKIPFIFDSAYNGSLVHSRAAFKISIIGTGYTHLRIDLHDATNAELATTTIAIGSLVDDAWFFAELLESGLVIGDTYHYHVYMTGGTVTASAQLFSTSSNTDPLYKMYYKPTAGTYRDADVPVFYDSEGFLLISERTNVADVADSDLTEIDIMPVDFSDNNVWRAWSYNNYIGLDTITGRIKFPAIIDPSTLYAEYNIKLRASSLDTKTLKLSNDKNRTLEDWHRKNIPFDPTLDPNGALIMEDNLITLNRPLKSNASQVAIGLNSEFVGSLSGESIIERMESAEAKSLEQELRLEYLEGRQQQGSDRLLDLFLDNQFSNTIETNTSKNAKLMDDIDWNNSWKNREGSVNFTQGLITNPDQHYMMEIIDEYNLEGIGQLYKGEMKYDSINRCYWLLSANGVNTIGEITKLSENMIDGRVEVIAKWILPLSGAGYYWVGLATDSDYLYFSCNNITSSNKIYKLKINADGSLGKAGYTKKNGETIDLTNSIDWTVTNTGALALNGIINYSTTEIAFLLCSTTTVSLVFLLKSNGGAGTTTTITGFGQYVGGSQSYGKSMCYYNNELFIRIDETTDNKRFIYKFNLLTDVASNVVFRSSARYGNARMVVSDGGFSGGICFSHTGDMLEVVCTPSNGKFIAKRAIKNALWAENQISGEYKMTASVNPNTPVATMVDPSGYYWTADIGVPAQEVDVYRFGPTGTKQSVRLVSTGTTTRMWTGVFDMTTDGTNVWMVGWDGTNYEVIKGLLSTLVAALSASDYSAASTLNIDSWGTLATGVGATNINALYGICYNADDDILYLLNDTDDKIDTLSVDGVTWTQGVYDLPAATNLWLGIAYKNQQLFVLNYTAATAPNRVYVIPLSKANATAMWRSHIYQDPSILTFVASGSRGIDFDGNDLVYNHQVNSVFYKMKTLEDPDVMQLHTFLDAYNVLLTSNVSCVTAIAERYFAPEDFVHPEDCPDFNYMCCGYVEEGFSLLHLDKYLSGRSTTGKPRYNPVNIREQHYKKTSSATPTGTNIINTDAGAYGVRSIFIEKDMIIVGASQNSSIASNGVIIDLKKGECLGFSTVAYNYVGLKYNGTLSERNDGKGFVGTVNSNLATSSSIHFKIYAHTFTKEDFSDYNGKNPKTFVSISGDGVSVDILIIDWDDYGNRTPVKVWKSLSNATTHGQAAHWIAPSGIMFLGDWVANDGYMMKSTKPIWEISSDNWMYLNAMINGVWIGVSIVGTAVTDISPNSRCWKTASGQWRHQLIVASYYSPYVCIVDVENIAKESIAYYSAGTGSFCAIDNYEDKIFTIQVDVSSAGYYTNIMILTKSRFNSKNTPWFTGGVGNQSAIGEFRNNWRNFDEICRNDNTRPSFANGATYINGSGSVHTYLTSVRYSHKQSILASGIKLTGMQFFHFQKMNTALHNSTEIEISQDATSVYYKENLIEE